MNRVLEPELMEGRQQVLDYAHANFDESHRRVIQLIDKVFPQGIISSHILDVGCGPGDVTVRLAHRFPDASIVAVDGSAPMIALANTRKLKEGLDGKRVHFLQGILPGAEIPREQYGMVTCTGTLHHFHNPNVLWRTMITFARPGTKLFVYDLMRPGSTEEAMHLVNKYVANEPERLKKDYYNSLLAAFEPEEIAEQLTAIGLPELSVEVVSDRHLIVSGERV